MYAVLCSMRALLRVMVMEGAGGARARSLNWGSLDFLIHHAASVRTSRYVAESLHMTQG